MVDVFLLETLSGCPRSLHYTLLLFFISVSSSSIFFDKASSDSVSLI